MPRESDSFPSEFLWGAATAAHQVEGDNRFNDWWPMEESGFLPYRSGEACRHFALYKQDFQLAKDFGHNAHRLSLEWSRIEPEEGRFDEQALAHYADVIAALRDRGLEPVVTLHHFTNPAWFAARGGWLARESTGLFERYVRTAIACYADNVRWWLTLNEPTVYAKHAYVTGDWPPGVKGSWPKALRCVLAMCRAHNAAYRVIHASAPDAMVSFAHSAPWIVACRQHHPPDRAVALLRDLLLNDLCFIQTKDGGRPLLDYVALNYYTRTVVRWRPSGRALFFGEDCLDEHHGPRRFSDIGSEICAEGLLAMLRRYAKLNLPILVTENGISTGDEELRLAYLREHLRALLQARSEGIDVRGYLHWTLMDNFEWALGMTARFGLFETDFATQARRPRPSAHFFREVCRTGRIPSPWPDERSSAACNAATSEGAA